MACDSGFLDLNGYEADLTGDEAFDVVMNVAEGLLELNAIVHRLSARKHGDG
jgi:prophage maintenance system killer protein